MNNQKAHHCLANYRSEAQASENYRTSVDFQKAKMEDARLREAKKPAGPSGGLR